MANICGCSFHYIAVYENEIGIKNNWIKVK